MDVILGGLSSSSPATDPDRRAAQDNLIAFTERVNPSYEAAPHHARIAQALQDVAARRVRRLIITMPPRHGKSELASIHFPPWYLGQHPEQRFIACSHTASLAYMFSRRARAVLSDPRYPFEVEIAPGAGTIQSWNLAGHRGGYVAAGVGGAITGMGANILLIDDPVKSRAEADSATIRDAVWEWYRGTALTRLEPDGAVVVIDTRWHEDDLIGRLLREQPGDWTLLHLPALDAEDRALWPERWPAAALRAIKTQVSSREWEAQYQGRPSPAEGGTFKRHWWRFYGALPAITEDWAQSWDMTFKETKSGSYVVGLVLCRAGANVYVVDCYRARVDFPGAITALRTMSAKHPRALAKLVENKANGPAVVASLRNEIAGLIEIEPDGSKEARANAVTPLVEAGNVWLPDPTKQHALTDARWVHDFVEELSAFPAGEHDDQVDALSQGLRRYQAREDRRVIVTGYADADPDADAAPGPGAAWGRW